MSNDDRTGMDPNPCGLCHRMRFNGICRTCDGRPGRGTFTFPIPAPRNAGPAFIACGPWGSWRTPKPNPRPVSMGQAPVGTAGIPGREFGAMVALVDEWLNPNHPHRLLATWKVRWAHEARRNLRAGKLPRHPRNSMEVQRAVRMVTQLLDRGIAREVVDSMR